MARTYKRDARGRFAGSGGGGSGGRGGRPATKRVSRETNRLTRDNAGRITGQGGSGATARGGRLKTAGGNQRATQLDRLKGQIGGTVSRSGKVKGGAAKRVARRPTYGSFSEKLQRTDPRAASQRRMNAESARPMQFSGRKLGGAADARFREAVATASYNRQRRSEGVAKEARKLLSLAPQSPSDWATRPRFSTVKKPSKIKQQC